MIIPRTKTFFQNTFFWCVQLLLITGCAFQAYANNTYWTFIIAYCYFATGAVIVKLFFHNYRHERDTFFLTYGICVFVAGLSQSYSLATFNNPMSTIDALFFFSNIANTPPFTSVQDRFIFSDSIWPILIWQQLYRITWKLGIDFGPYIGVMFNALVVGITGSITVNVARQLYGHDHRRLELVKVLFAFCGIFILFGSILIRDCFTTFLTVLALWGGVRLLTKPTLTNVIYATLIFLICILIMQLFRVEGSLILGILGILTYLFYSTRSGISSMFVLVTTACICFALSTLLVQYGQSIKETQKVRQNQYGSVSIKNHYNNSLGVQLVLNQPAPIRLLVGSGTMLITPIPLWKFFHTNSNSYHILKGYNGFYQIAVFPLVLLGYLSVYRLYKTNHYLFCPTAYLGVYFVLTLGAVVMTSLEQRHLAQFMPSCIVLAALPDTTNLKTKRKLRNITSLWLVFVFLIHFIWLLLK